jgi:hypothetical protein
VQTAVDTKHPLITHEVTNVGTDRSQLASVAKQTKDTLQTASLDVVADRGYFNSAEILACEEAGITVTWPKPMTSNAKAEGRFGKPDFRYVAEEDIYICPAGERRLPLHERGKRAGPAPLLDQRLSELPHQAKLHHQQGATDHALGA